MQLTIFYDGTCPLCVAEMDMLRELDTNRDIQLEDIYAADFEDRFPDIDTQKANRYLHGMKADGSMLFGLDVTAKAWTLVGQKQWISILRWPVIRWFSDLAYLFFARNRQSISRVVMGKKKCSPDGECRLDSDTKN